MKSFLVYKFACASCSSSYIRETCRHFKTRTEEHIKKDSKLHISKHLHSALTCFESYNSLFLKIIVKANSKYDFKIKEALHINWKKPKLNAQQNHLAVTYSLWLAPLLFVFLSLFFYISFSSIFFIISDIDYRHLLLSYSHCYFISLQQHIYLSSIIFILSDASYWHLLLS